MTIDIQQFKDNEIIINDKLVVKNTEENWVAKIELEPEEIEALHKHIRANA